MLLILVASPGKAQDQETSPPKGKKGSVFLYWGYNRSAYTRSNLHLFGPDYDFTLHRVTAQDRPSKLGKVYISPITFTIPQYEYRIGYFFKDRFAVSLGLDHLKYVVDLYQMTSISGTISEVASPKYEGSYRDQPISLEKDLLQLEHTDGLNLLTVNLDYLHPLFSFAKNNFSVYLNTGVGASAVITKTKAKVLNSGIDNKFHLAGYSFNAKSGPRLEFKNRVFLLFEMQGGYVRLPSVLINGDAPERAHHAFGFVEGSLALGVNVIR